MGKSRQRLGTGGPAEDWRIRFWTARRNIDVRLSCGGASSVWGRALRSRGRGVVKPRRRRGAPPYFWGRRGLTLRGASMRPTPASVPLFPLTIPSALHYPTWLGVDETISTADLRFLAGEGNLTPRGTAGGGPVRPIMDPKKVTAWRQIGLLSSIPFVLALAPIVGYFLGKFLDQKFRTEPWLSIVLLALGFVAGVRETIKIIKVSQRED